MTEAERIASRADRGRALFATAIAGICLIAIAGLVGAIVANVVNVQQDTKITHVERSSKCETNPTGKACQTVKRKSDEAQSIRDTCRSFWKVGYPCPKPGSGVTTSSPGGDALQPANAGQQPAPAKAPAHHGDVDQQHTHPHTAPAAADEPPDAVSPLPTTPSSPTGKPAGEEASGSTTPPAEDTTPESSSGLLDVPGVTVGESPCPVKALGIRVCTE